MNEANGESVATALGNPAHEPRVVFPTSPRPLTTNDADIRGDLDEMEGALTEVDVHESFGLKVIRRMHELLLPHVSVEEKMEHYTSARKVLQHSIVRLEHLVDIFKSCYERKPMYLDERCSEVARRYRELLRSGVRQVDVQIRRCRIRLRFIKVIEARVVEKMEL